MPSLALLSAVCVIVAILWLTYYAIRRLSDVAPTAIAAVITALAALLTAAADLFGLLPI
ncbi:hypothetical protein ACWGH8_08505 [Nonomuraea muscovyensis]|jgi:hypothetical protein|uniref:Uncharacterized protein n=1 Tax=Nonomuraea muscovyensis TaxID=1124761 RepID=A0A7X0EY61_9ACTN|nr:hypothetical protein [Nonomuraea muscovyensis]MBB6345470.1 hypothetical protein [Nonomuraea muscovyensis]MDF2712403.1 hypothetical protein [Nonomuraea muscovyensis]